MKILLVAATANEISPSLEWLAVQHDVEVLITGIGSTATAYSLARSIAAKKPAIVIQAGIAGSFSTRYAPGSVVLVREEVIADLGATEQGALTDIFDMGFVDRNEAPFTDRMMVNPLTNNFGLDAVRGATVNAISSTPAQVSMILEKYHPVTESMEGAALHYVCLMENISFLQLRAVSNFVGERNKANWQFKEAIANLNDTLKHIILELTTERQ